MEREMHRELAEQLIGEYLRFGDIFNRITELSDGIDDKPLRSLVRGAAAEAQFDLYEIVRAVGKCHPDLVPES